MFLVKGLNDKCLRTHFVISAAMFPDGVEVVADPEVEPLKGAQGADPHIGQFIFDAWRYFREIIPGNQPIALKVAQRKCQHALRHAFDFLLER